MEFHREDGRSNLRQVDRCETADIGFNSTEEIRGIGIEPLAEWEEEGKLISSNWYDPTSTP